jgi:hypothetical protein
MTLLRTTMPTRAYALAFVFAAGAFFITAARADEPKTIGECEKIQAADAYNQCLAKFGPTSKVRSLEPERPGDVKANGAEAAATAKPLTHRGRASRRGHGGGRHRATSGRKRASFSVSHGK